MTISTGSSVLDALNKSSSASSSASTATKSNSTIDQSGFLKLLSAQLTTQDPTAPTDNSQMVQQMATFSQVAGITDMSQTLKAMSTDLKASRFGDAASWIGRAALVQSNVVTAASNGAFAGEIGLPEAAGDVTMSLVDQSGNTVYSQDLGAKAAGAVDWNWDGKDANGKAVAGPLQMVVSATNAAGTARIAPTISAWAEIASVQSPTSGTTKLITGLGTFSPSDIQAIA